MIGGEWSKELIGSVRPMDSDLIDFLGRAQAVMEARVIAGTVALVGLNLLPGTLPGHVEARHRAHRIAPGSIEKLELDPMPLFSD
jgi:hypothetical protein